MINPASVWTNLFAMFLLGLPVLAIVWSIYALILWILG